jgi:hypothetical protein
MRDAASAAWHFAFARSWGHHRDNDMSTHLAKLSGARQTVTVRFAVK